MDAPFYRLAKAALGPLCVAGLAVMVLAGGMIAWGGAWGVVWPPVLALVVGRIVFPVLLVPAAGLGSAMQAFGKNNRALAHVLQALATGWVALVLSGFSAFVLALAAEALHAAPLVAGAWCCAAGATPWAVFARGDRDNIFFTLLVEMQALAVPLALLARGAEAGFWHVFGIMAVLALLQAAWEESRAA